MIQSGGFGTFNPINPSKIASKVINKVEYLFNKVTRNDDIFGTGITLTNNDINDITKL